MLNQALGTDGFQDVLNLSLESEPLAKPILWIYWGSVTAFCTLGMDNLIKAVVIVYIRFARSLHADQMFQIAGSLNEPPIVTIDGLEPEAMETEHPPPVISRSQSAHSHKSESAPTSSRTGAKGDVSSHLDASGTRSENTHEHDHTIVSQPDAPIFAGEDLTDGKVKRAALHMLNDWKIQLFLDFVIVFNIVFVALNQWDSPQFLVSASFFVELACTFVFLCESVLRFAIAGDFDSYWSSSSNRVEILLVFCGFIGFWSSSAGFLLAFPAVRIFRLLRHSLPLKILYHGCVSSFRGILTLSTVMIVLGVSWAIMGRYMIEDLMDNLPENFGTFSNSLITIFELFVGDMWSTTLYAAMATRTSYLGQAFVAMFILFWVFCSKFIFSAMYIAIVIEHFQSADLLAAVRQGDLAKYLLSILMYRPFSDNQVADEHQETGKVTTEMINAYYFASPEIVKAPVENKNLKPTRKTANLMLLLSYASAEKAEEDFTYLTKPPPLTMDNMIKNACILLVSSHYYQMFLVVVIFVSSIALIGTPIDEDLPVNSSDLYLISYNQGIIISNVVTIIFTAEFVVNVMVYGSVFHKGAVLRSAWGIADLIVLVFAWFQFFNSFQNGFIAKIFRLVRVITPFFRLVKRFKTLREIFERIMSSTAPLLYVCIFR